MRYIDESGTTEGMKKNKAGIQVSSALSGVGMIASIGLLLILGSSDGAGARF